MRPPRRDDALIAAALAVPSLVQVLVAPIAPRPVGVLIALATTVPIAWRRTYPAAAALAGTALWCLHTDGFIVLGYVAAFLLFYSLGAHDPDDRRVIAVCAFALITGAVGTTQSHPVLYEYVATFFIVVGPTVVGRLARRQREQAERLRDLTEHLERERERTAHLAVDEERARIARELHDVVAHGLSVIAVQADAAEAALDRDPSAPARRFDAIRAHRRARRSARCAACSASCARTRTATTLAPQPGLAQLDALVERARGAGLPVERRRDGEPRELPPASTSPPTGSSRRRSPTSASTPRGAPRHGRARRGGPRNCELRCDDGGAGRQRHGARRRPRPRRHARARGVYGGELRAGTRDRAAASTSARPLPLGAMTTRPDRRRPGAGARRLPA